MGVTKQEVAEVLKGLDNNLARKKQEWAAEKSAPKTSYVANTSSVQKPIPTLNKPKSDARAVQQKYNQSLNSNLQKWSNPSYKMNDTDKAQAKAYEKRYFNQGTERKSPLTPQQIKQLSTIQNKTNPIASVLVGFQDLPVAKGIENIANKYGDTSVNITTPDTKTVRANAYKQNPIGTNVGKAAGTLAEYAIGSKIAQGIPVLNKATQSAGNALSKIPVLNKVGSQHIANVLGDTALDVALDTVPTTIDNVQGGKSAKDTTLDALKNLGTNVAFNVGGEALGAGLDALKEVDLKKVKADKQAQKALQKDLQKRIEEVSVRPIANKTNTIGKNASVSLPRTEIPTLNNTVNEITTNTDNAFKSSNTTLNPLQTESGMKLRSYDNKTVQKTDLPDDIKKEFAENPDVYKVLSNAETKANANAITNASTTEQAVNQFNVLLGKKDPTAIPLGYDTAKRLIDEGKREEAVTLIRNMSSELTKSGQFSQAAAITMMKSDPMTALRYAERELDTINAAGKKKFGSKWNDFSLTDDEINAFSKINQGDTEKIKSLYDGISKRISETYPSTTWEKFVELRKMSFLINPRTHLRNSFSNAISLPLRSISDRVSAIGERGYKAILEPDYQLTQSLFGGNSEQKKIANTLFETKWKDVLNNTSNKWEDVGKNAIKDKRVFQTGWLEKLRQFDYKMLGEIEDNPFVKKNFTNRLGSYMHVNNITDINQVPEEAQIIAYQEALKATFKDDNYITNLFKGVKKSTGKFGELVLPFTKTPANLTMRSIEYSPLGIAKAINNAKNGAEAYQIIDDVAKSLTGTSAIALGYYLADKGFITGSLSQDKDKRNFEKQQGKQAYSVKIKLPNSPEMYVSYDWALPTSAMFIMGADIANAIKEDDTENASVVGSSALNAVKAGFNSIADQSSLTNLSDLFKADTATGKVDFAGNALNTLTDIPSEMIPTLAGATARAIDPNLRTTYDNTSEANNKINQLKAKIPMLSKTLPESYNNWGNSKTRTNTPLESAFAQFVNPGTFSNSNITPLDNEINRLYKQTGDKKVFPNTASWSVIVNGENKKLNNEEYSNYQKSMGNHAYVLINSLQNSEKYQNTSDETKVNMSDELYKFSNALAKSELFGYDIKNSDTYGKIYQAYKQYGPDGAIAFLEEKNALQNAGFTTGSKKAVEAYEQGGEQGLQQYANDKQLFDDLGLSMNSDKLSAYYDTYGSDGLKQLKEVKDLADSNMNGSISNGELIPTLNYLGYTGEQAGELIHTLGGELSDQAQQSYNDLGNDGVYQYYNNKHYADYDGNGSLKKDELISYLQQTYSSRNEMAYWFDRLKPPQKGKSNNNPFY